MSIDRRGWKYLKIKLESFTQRIGSDPEISLQIVLHLAVLPARMGGDKIE